MQKLTDKERVTIKREMRVAGDASTCRWLNGDGSCKATSHRKNECSTECRFFEPGTLAMVEFMERKRKEDAENARNENC